MVMENRAPARVIAAMVLAAKNAESARAMMVPVAPASRPRWPR
jgi:hypothetical protein